MEVHKTTVNQTYLLVHMQNKGEQDRNMHQHDQTQVHENKFISVVLTNLFLWYALL